MGTGRHPAMPSSRHRNGGQTLGAPPPSDCPPHIEVIPMGTVDGVAVSVAAGNLQAVGGLPADVMPLRSDLVDAFDPSRRQYNAWTIIQALEKDAPEGTLRLGITGRDLFVPVLSYVLGEARVGGFAAVASTHRLRHGSDGAAVPVSHMYARLAKVALHEMAHVLGLPHCREAHCLMRFSLDVAHIDRLTTYFCHDCTAALAAARRHRMPAGGD
jgi:archaemetzincin